MHRSKNVHALAVSNVQLARPYVDGDPGYLGRATFCVNGHTWFSRIPVYRDGGGIRLELPVDPTRKRVPAVRDDVRREVERQIASVVEELVG